jgi:Family of unknown function (DUF6510)
MSVDELHTDGNTIAGLLQEVFVAEITACGRVCQSCGQQHPIGSHRLYTGAGYVLRCPGCGDIAACITTLPGQYAISLRGTWRLDRSE